LEIEIEKISRRVLNEKSKRGKSLKMKNSTNYKNNIIEDEKNFYIQKIRRNIEMKIKNTNLNLNELGNEKYQKIKSSNNGEKNFNRNFISNRPNNSYAQNNLRIISNENEQNYKKKCNKELDTIDAKNESLNGSRLITRKLNSNLNSKN